MSPIVRQSQQHGDSGAAKDRPFHIAPGQATYTNAIAIRRAVLARLATFERALLWRWCIGVAVAYVGLFALLVILVLATHSGTLDEHGQSPICVPRPQFCSLSLITVHGRRRYQLSNYRSVSPAGAVLAAFGCCCCGHVGNALRAVHHVHTEGDGLTEAFSRACGGDQGDEREVEGARVAVAYR
jgi:hypothetical protein